ncbi:unnamed protein product [Urochloa decumbens]|uniref:Uncharacterized protein n=1 Tax=Urochloa decumbens TaxID=240449 RepID=A0ABC8YA29_9POAL
MEFTLLQSRGRHLAVHLLRLACACTCAGSIAPAIASGGRWDLLQRSIGVSAMHMQLLHNDRVIIFDRTNFDRSNLSLPGGRCRVNPRDQALPNGDCTAHSVEYHVTSNSFRPLFLFTDTWCSSGTVAPDGTLVQTGGWRDGYNNTRTMPACTGHNSCEPATGRSTRTHSPPAGGTPPTRSSPTAGHEGSHAEPPLSVRTTHLNIDGNLFIFANNRAILLDCKTNTVVRTYPVLAGGDPRNYPSSGSSVLLPLKPNPTEAEVLVCGGAPKGSYHSSTSRRRPVTRAFVPALTTCGRIKITDAAPAWVVETMPSPRVMGDVILLPNGAEVAIINGATHGTAGWDGAKTPAFAPVIYRPGHTAGDRFEQQNASGIPRMYHSSVVLLRDGRLLVGGSNPHLCYNFSNVAFPTDLSLEAFSPDYLDASNDMLRPRIRHPSPAGAAARVAYGKKKKLKFSVPASARRRRGGLGEVSVTMVAPSFTTHSFAMNQRLLFIDVTKVAAVRHRHRVGTYHVSVRMPATAVLAPPGYYMVFVVNELVPGEGIWVHIQ